MPDLTLTPEDLQLTPEDKELVDEFTRSPIHCLGRYKAETRVTLVGKVPPASERLVKIVDYGDIVDSVRYAQLFATKASKEVSYQSRNRTFVFNRIYCAWLLDGREDPIVVGTRPRPGSTGFRKFLRALDGSLSAYHVVADGRESAPLKSILFATFSPDGRHVGLWAELFQQGLTDARKYQLYFDGVPVEAYQKVTPVMFDATSQHYFYIGTRCPSVRSAIVDYLCINGTAWQIPQEWLMVKVKDFTPAGELVVLTFELKHTPFSPYTIKQVRIRVSS